jgi:glucuronate isomerase
MNPRNGKFLAEDRFFDANPVVRAVARELYESVKNLPIVSPHGHVDPEIFSANRPFENPAELFLKPDHYVLRMLYSQGVPMEAMGIAPADGRACESDPRRIWQTFADHFYLFRGTPSGAWLNYSFAVTLGVREKLTGDSAQRIYDAIDEKLRSQDFLPRTLFKRFNIEVLATTDAAADPLHAHTAMRNGGFEGRVIPTFRPDGVTDLMARDWAANMRRLEERVGYEIPSFPRFIQALAERRRWFKSMGATATDHGVRSPATHRLDPVDAERLFQKGRAGTADGGDAAAFTAHMLMEMASMSIEDGLVMQIHPGSDRNHNRLIYDRFGPDRGCDIPMQGEYTGNLKELLNAYGNDTRLALIVFTLDETTYSRELAPLAGHYPAMKLGPPWWFHDSMEGMRRFRAMTTETAGIYNTAGFNDDTRAFLSIPARHDLSRRMDADFLAGLVARHIVDMEEALSMAHDLAYGLAKKAYRL